MFEVIATESSYVRSLDILISHFMDDPGMNPDLPDGRRVLTRHQYHVIFSNVREVREVAKKYVRNCYVFNKHSGILPVINIFIASLFW